MFFRKKTKAENKVYKDFNWDDCNMETNGENFFIERYAAKWKLCIDIGANKGDYAAKILKINSECRVICFEPNGDLIGNIKAKNIREVYEFAVGDSSGVIEMNMNTADSTQSSIYRKSGDTKVIKVPTITIDEFAERHNLRHIDFVKIDTEVNEVPVLKGMRLLCAKRAIDMIQFEYGGTYLDAHTTLLDVYELLKENYIICHMYPSGLVPFKCSPEMETYKYSNWIAMSRDIFIRD